MKLLNIWELNISDVDNYMVKKDDMDRLHERLIIISGDDMDNWLAKIVCDVDSLHVEIEK